MSQGTISEVGEAFMTVVAPVIGLTLANVMFFSGVPAMLRCKREGSLGDMNPGPFPVVLANCVGWMGYAILARDCFVFFGAAPGSIIGLFFTVVGYGLTPHGSDARANLEKIILLLSASLVFVAFYVGFASRWLRPASQDGDGDDSARAHSRSVMGLFCNAVLVLYYSSPLSTIRTVLVEKNAKTLYAPTCAANALNGFCWATYGMALGDFYLVAPNAVGAALGVAQLLLIRIFGDPTSAEGKGTGVFEVVAGASDAADSDDAASESSDARDEEAARRD